MLTIELIDHKGDSWKLEYWESAQQYLHKGEGYWKAWWDAPKRPKDFKNYMQVPLPIFTDWWPHKFSE